MTTDGEGRRGQDEKTIGARGGLMDRLTGLDALEAHERPESLNGERFVEGDDVCRANRRTMVRGLVFGMAAGTALGLTIRLIEAMI